MRIKRLKKIEPRKVYAVQTTSETFIADGLAHHNCYSCNVCMHGNKVAYTLFMVNTIGYTIEEIEELESLKYSVTKFTLSDMIEIEQKYKALAHRLAETKGIEL